MDAHVAAIAAGTAGEQVWLLEHPPVYTAGTSARTADLIAARFPVHQAGRGGQLTYHGPGQRVAYVMLDMRQRTADVRRFVATLEEWLIRTLAELGVVGERREDRVGVWVSSAGQRAGIREAKIAAIGVRIKRWITLHGIALNVDCDLSHYAGIVPCGVSEPSYGVTSLADLGRPTAMAAVDVVLRRTFEDLFGPTVAKTEPPGRWPGIPLQIRAVPGRRRRSGHRRTGLRPCHPGGCAPSPRRRTRSRHAGSSRGSPPLARARGSPHGGSSQFTDVGRPHAAPARGRPPCQRLHVALGQLPIACRLHHEAYICGARVALPPDARNEHQRLHDPTSISHRQPPA
jgi:lipoyl(octanoyl) transferase